MHRLGEAMGETGQKRPRAKLELLGESSVDMVPTSAEAAEASNRRIRPRSSSGSPAQQRLSSLTSAECSDGRIRPHSSSGLPAQQQNVRPPSSSGSPAQQQIIRPPSSSGSPAQQRIRPPSSSGSPAQQQNIRPHSSSGSPAQQRIRPPSSSGSPAQQQNIRPHSSSGSPTQQRIRPPSSSGSPAQQQNIRPHSSSGSPAQQRIRPPSSSGSPAQQQNIRPHSSSGSPAQQRIRPPSSSGSPAQQQNIRPHSSSGSPAQQRIRPPSSSGSPAQQQIIRPHSSSGSPAQQRIRPPSSSGSPAQQRLSSCPSLPVEITAAYHYFLVYLPNATSVKVRVDGAILFNLTVKKFVELARVFYEQNTTSNTEACRPIEWGGRVHLDDLKGLSVDDGDFTSLVNEMKEEDRCLLLFDGHPDTVHFHQDLWNVTPEPHLLETLPQDYTLFSALADELDNSLQAVYQLEFGKKRLICVELDPLQKKIVISDTGKGMDGTVENSISKWGTLGASLNKHGRAEAIGGRPPYLKPNFGMYGFGGIGAGFHLGGSISVLSKTETSERVAVLHLPKNTLHTTTTGGKVWKTPGEFRPPTPEEIAFSPHGSFTKVEISDLKGEIPQWRVAGIQRKLKDYYFPYIQNDEGTGGTTFTPVEIQVNGVNLAEVLGGEVAHTNYFSGNGKPYILTLEFTRNSPDPGNADIPDKANARITCHYFPIKQGREAIDDIIEKLAEEDPEFMEVNFEKFPRLSIRRLGRLLPDSQSEKPLPFMGPKRTLKPNPLNKHCYKRVKAFIDVDAGFTPNQTKMDLSPRDIFSEALLNLGSGGQSRGSGKWTYSEPGLVTVSIERKNLKTGVNEVIQPKDLHKDYEQWITLQHCTHDTGPIFEESDVIFCSTSRHKDELKLNMTDEVFQVLYGIKCRAGKTDIEWKVGSGKAPVRLKLHKGIPGFNNDSVLYVTVECFVSAGFEDAPGEARIICRPMEVPEDRGSKEIRDEAREPDFVLGESLAFPIEDILFSNKYEVVKEEMWQKRMEKVQGKLPGFVELLNDQETLKLVGHESIPKLLNQTAGVALPTEIFAVVRPKLCKHLEKLESTQLDQKFIISEEMEMKLLVRRMKYHPEEVLEKDMEEAEIVFDTKISASTCKIGNQKGLKGLYKFSSATFESTTKKIGTYFLSFSLVSAKHQDVDEYIVRMNVSPSLRTGKWKVCSHAGDCNEYHNTNHRDPPAVRLRLGRERPGIFYLSRFDEFDNPMEFAEIPSDIACSISTPQGDEVMISTTILKDSLKITNDKLNLEIPITLDEGNLAPFKPTMQAALKMSIADVLTESFRISVLPGGVSSARVKESSASLERNLHPGQIIDQIVFERAVGSEIAFDQVLLPRIGHMRDVLDKCQNPVSSGQTVKVVLDGFRLQDKTGSERAVDENGCLDLGMRLRVTAGYGQSACVELWSTEEQSLLVGKTFKTIQRSLRVKNVPDSIRVGSDLMGIQIEVVDENGEMDHGMDGQDHTLTVDWNRSIFIPLHRGQCTLQPIRMPRTEGRWKGCVSHTKDPNLRTDILVYVKKDVESDRMGAANDNPGVPNDLSLVPVDTRSVSELEHMRALCQSSLEGALKLENKVESLTEKLRQQKKYLEKLQTMQENYETSKQQYHASVDLNRLQVDNGCTKEQVEVQIANLPRTNAAKLMLQAKREHSEPVLDDVIGVVALLGAVETKELNRALVEFLGLENMLAIICRSKSAAEYIGMPSIDKVLDKNKSLSDFVRSRNLEISGRFRVITLTDEASFFKRVDGQPAVDETHPQKLLNMGPIDKRPKGSQGYAVNMIQLDQEQLATRISRHHGLRESLFFKLFGFLEVFDTTENMMNAESTHSLTSSALSLDGGLIRAKNVVELGFREDPVVWFPTWIPLQHDLEIQPQPLQSITPPRTPTAVHRSQRRGLHDEMERSWRDAEQIHLKENVPTKITAITEKIRRTEEKMKETLRELRNYNEHWLPRREQIVNFSRFVKLEAAKLGSPADM